MKFEITLIIIASELIGVTKCSRAQTFTLDNGIVGIEMCAIPDTSASKLPNSPEYFMKAVTPQPSLNATLVGKMMLQNLPSVLVAHALEPKPKDIKADLYATRRQDFPLTRRPCKK